MCSLLQIPASLTGETLPSRRMPRMVCDSQTAADIAEAMREGGGDDDEEGESEDKD